MKYGGLGVSELRRLRQLEEESRKLRQLIADLSLDKVMLQDVIQKSSEADAATYAHRLSATGLLTGSASGVMRQACSGLAHKPVRRILDARLKRRIEEIAQTRVSAHSYLAAS